MKTRLLNKFFIAMFVVLIVERHVSAAEPSCQAKSGPTVTPVIELYTSEGCSSCPPADQWLSTLKAPAAQGQVVVQAFHVGYWDYIGWADRFASPAHTTRQRQIATINQLRSIYTPQIVRDGLDWRDWHGTSTAKLVASLGTASSQAARATVQLRRTARDTVEADVSPTALAERWSAYWSVTEHAHESKVKAGENAGESLKHDFVVRQYVPVGDYQGAKTLKFSPIAATPGHAQQVNLVVFDGKTGRTLQALSLACTGA
jgi:hypothetical protein